MIVGALRREGTAVRNALAVLETDGTVAATYDKHHLVPFGEYLPLPDLFETLGLSALAQNAGRLSRGTAPQRIEVDGLPPFQPLICYEAIFPHEILKGADRPDWLLQLTNDAWFGTFSGPFQHLTQAQFRAVEYGLPVVRAANTGISAVIDPYGRLVAFLSLGEQNAIDALLPAPLPATVYARTGDLPVILLSLIGLLVGVALARAGANAQRAVG